MFSLTHQVTLLRPPAPVRGERGGQSYGVRQEVPALAMLQSASGGQTASGQVAFNYNQRLLVVRRNPDITTSWNVRVDGEVLDVKAVLPAGHTPSHRNFIRLVCEAADASVVIASVGTGPQPVFLSLLGTAPADGTRRQDFDLTGQTGKVVPEPTAGSNITVESVPGASLAGQYITVLYPAAWGEPTAVYSGTGSAINQKGAFRFVPARLTGVTAQLADLYTAMVSVNRKASDTPLQLNLEWT